MLKLLAHRRTVGWHWHFLREAKLFQAAVLIEVRQDRARNGIATVDVITLIGCERNADIRCITGEVVPQISIRNNLAGRVHIARRDPGVVIEAVVHQVAHIRPPVIGMDDYADQMVIVACHRHDLYKIRNAVKAGFTTVYAWKPPEKLIFIEQHPFAMLATRGDVIGFAATDLLEQRECSGYTGRVPPGRARTSTGRDRADRGD